jgi:hypothetical protein
MAGKAELAADGRKMREKEVKELGEKRKDTVIRLG